MAKKILDERLEEVRKNFGSITNFKIRYRWSYFLQTENIWCRVDSIWSYKKRCLRVEVSLHIKEYVILWKLDLDQALKQKESLKAWWRKEYINLALQEMIIMYEMWDYDNFKIYNIREVLWKL